MKKIFISLFFVVITFCGFSQNTSKQILGKWSYSVDAGGTILTGVFHFYEKDGQLAGEILSDDGYKIPFTKLEQKEANQFYFEAKTDYDLYKITLNFEREKFSGSSYEGDAPITGKRKE
ncbi:hypothetical protein GM418_04660 [Maribellus comscasis]|uniref:DUF5640 domain-containing protein n=1 Tax=Maribellus comscasis TaxID=2681766 RepID=A0A6I6JTN4_9BACT|nr:hypothetical protein [Maribellus comscasis]QGY42973.1 hypothetical protein GM418_04660 [Maribellus comscasis]